ncbi:MAG: C1 family peptidase [Armatimonadetes bacterium]|nr:C1 family peptidase [Armatimonadota bacterium]
MATVIWAASLCPAQPGEHRLGLRLAPDEVYSRFIPALPPKAATPDTVVLTNDLPTPASQGRQGSCTAWATGFALKSYQEEQERRWGLSDSRHLFSPAYLYNQINGGVDAGSCIHDALNLLTEQGCVSLATMPYSDRDYRTQPSQAARTEAQQYRLLSWAKLDRIDDATFQGHLAQGQAVMLGIEVYDNFYRFKGSQVLQGQAGNLLGYHAIALVGYDRNRTAYLLQNSWGTDWGDKGRVWIEQGTLVKLTRQAYVATDRTEPAPPSPGTLSAAVVSTRQQRDPRFDFLCYQVFKVRFSEPVRVSSFLCTGPGGTDFPPAELDQTVSEADFFVVRVDGGAFPGGRYRLRFDVTRQNGTRSQLEVMAQVAGKEPLMMEKGAISLPGAFRAMTAGASGSPAGR